MRRPLDFWWQAWKGPQVQIESLNTQLEQIASSDRVRLQEILGVGRTSGASSRSSVCCPDVYRSESSAEYARPIKVAIEVESSTEPLKCEGVTVVVSLHGALISTTIPLAVGMKITLYVIITDKRAKGRVVYVDPESPLRCGVELDQPGNIWEVSLHPEDWDAKRT